MPDAEAEVGDPRALDDVGVIEEHGGVREVAAEGDAMVDPTERHRAAVLPGPGGQLTYSNLTVIFKPNG
jgi:hypothetical protein